MPNAADTVKTFLSLMESRDLEAASAMLAPGFKMTFPGDAEFTTLDELVSWGASRYLKVGKHYERFDALAAPERDGAEIVYCFGTLYGVWLDGEAFDGIRFIDRFVVADGLLVEQRVWNDLAEIRSQNAAG